MPLYTSTEKGYRPGRIEETPRKSKPEKSNGKYKFSKPIYRITYENQIRPLFDNSNKVIEKGKSYYGKIEGIEARIDFSLNHPCLLNTETEEELTSTHKKILDRLLGRNGKSSKN